MGKKKVLYCFKPFSHTTNLQQTILNSSKHKDDKSLFINKDILLNRVEIIEAKGEIAHYVQFILLPQWFQKLSASYASVCVFKWERVKLHLMLFSAV